MKIKIGTRASRLAMAQTNMFVSALKQKFPDVETETVKIKTLGDAVQDKSLPEIGGSGVFAGAIEAALGDGKIDIAVHSAKDLPLSLADGLQIKCVLKRGNPRDVLVTRKGEELGENAIIGTSSIRRRINIERLYPNVAIKDIRGNVDTRIKKLKDGMYDGIILAAAGLERLNILEDNTLDFHKYEINEFVCAPCQGIIAMQSRIGEYDEILDAVNDIDTLHCFETERYVLRLLGGDCSMPSGAYAEVSDGTITLTVTKDCQKIMTGSDKIVNRLKLAEEQVRALWE